MSLLTYTDKTCSEWNHNDLSISFTSQILDTKQKLINNKCTLSLAGNLSNSSEIPVTSEFNSHRVHSVQRCSNAVVQFLGVNVTIKVK